MYTSTKNLFYRERRETRINYRPTYLILLPRERERERSTETESKPFITMYTSTKNLFYREQRSENKL